MGTDQRITREEALRLATINNARLMFDEARQGLDRDRASCADLVVLSEDILTGARTRIRDARVLLTIVGGKVVYEP